MELRPEPSRASFRWEMRTSDSNPYDKFSDSTGRGPGPGLAACQGGRSAPALTERSTLDQVHGGASGTTLKGRSTGQRSRRRVSVTFLPCRRGSVGLFIAGAGQCFPGVVGVGAVVAKPSDPAMARF
ncbi:hypothetical protein GCM10009646_28800 [Streptomyces aureus]